MRASARAASIPLQRKSSPPCARALGGTSSRRLPIMMAKEPATKAKPADPSSFVIFGASGDLTHRLLVPALYNLAADGLLPHDFAIIGVARGEKPDDAFRADLAAGLVRFASGKVEKDV